MQRLWTIMAGIAAALVGACTLPAAAPPSLPGRVYGTAACTPPNASQFTADKLWYLQPGFNLDGNGFSGPNNSGTYTPPMRNGQPAANSQIVADVQAAYQDAPVALKCQLANLTTLFIDPDPSHENWGFWEVAGQGSANGTYIGLVQSFWTNPNPNFVRPTLLTYQNELTSMLLYRSSSPVSPWPPAAWRSAPVYTSSDQNTVTKALLAILAHEAGHIFFKDGSPLANWTCGQTHENWFTKTWQTTGFPLSPTDKQRFHEFGVDIGQSNAHDDPVSKIAGFVHNGQYTAATASLDKIYGLHNNQLNWASLLARVAADEDFAETYTLLNLAYAATPATSLQVTSCGSTIDLLAGGLNNPSPDSILNQKGECVKANMPFP